MMGKGMVAGLIATIVLSGLMVMRTMMGLMPELDLDLPKMLASMMGSPAMPVLGWVAHFLIGIVGYGIAMALLNTRLPGRSATGHGILLAVAGWLMMMVVLMPMAGAGMFGMALGPMAPVMTLALHLVFGAVLGWTYGRLTAGAADSAGRSA